MKKLFPTFIRVPLIFFLAFGMMEYFVDSGDTPAFIKFPLISLFLIIFLVVLIAIEITWKATENILYQISSPEDKAKIDLENQTPLTQTDWYKTLLKKLTAAEPVENNEQLLLAHDYDGIQELDNRMPPWWVYLFYGCIGFAAVYLIRFEILGADNQEMELKKEIAQAKIDVAEYMKTAPDLMDESKVTQLTAAADLASGKEIFKTNCAVCHKEDGGGKIGPNLTDDRWILGGGIKNIFHTLENGGRDGKGMVSWKGILKPKEMQLVGSYVMSLAGSNPKEAKAPEGKIWVNPTAKLEMK
jgi:cytochrome c oxidase cbb3-type subunit III